MADVRDLVAELFHRLPARSELSEERLTRLAYLADWKHAIGNKGRQITNLKWYFDSYGPYAPQVFDAAHRSQIFQSRPLANEWEDSNHAVSLYDRLYKPSLKQSEREAIAHVAGAAAMMSWPDLGKLVASTYPILAGQRYEFIDMGPLAISYLRLMQQIAEKKRSAIK